MLININRTSKKILNKQTIFVFKNYKTELCYGIIAISGNETKMYKGIKSGSYIDCKLKYKNSKFT